MAKKKEKKLDLAEKVIKYLSKNPGIPIKQKRIARALGVRSEEYESFKLLLRQLFQEGRISRHRHSFYIPQADRFVKGKIAFANAGFAFVTTSDGKEIFIGAGKTGTALPGDTVKVEIFLKKTGPREEGVVREVIQRSTDPLIGIAKKGNQGWTIELQKQNAPAVNFKLRSTPPGLKNNQMVSITDIEGEDPRQFPVCSIKEILGTPADPADDFIIILKSHNLSKEFPAKVLQEVEQIDTNLRLEGRLDLRREEIFTIDPPEAKDFDDAVSLSKDQNGKWILGVHIADVSYFVREGSAIDREARKRGTSIYCSPDVVPMLPPKLTEDLCSLQPEVDRLTFSVIMQINSLGIVEKVEFVPSVIKSVKRFTYEEVQNILDKESGPHVETLLDMRELSRILYKRRIEQGSVDFDLPEPIFKLDEAGVPTSVTISQRLESHRIIEEFMLMANRCVAEYIGMIRKKENLPFIYRVHPEPTEEDIEGFYYILNSLGLHYKKPKKFTPKHMQEILFEIQELPYKNYLEQVALRSMEKAIYATQSRGHFGLAFRYYTHFTSPIRRYPDLVVHRLLKKYLNSTSANDIARYRKLLPRVAKQATDCELRAMDIEREYTKVKQIRFLQNKIGNWYEGVITGVTDFGFFVEISKYLVEGLVHVKTLMDDYYEFDSQTHTLRGRRFGRVFRLGDIVRVRVTDVSVEERRVDLEWGE